MAALEARVVSVAETTITLECEEQTLKLPRKYFPGKVKTGDTLYLPVLDQKTYQASREALAKDILNEILRGSKTDS